MTPHTLPISGKGKKTEKAARIKKLYNTLTRSNLISSVWGRSHLHAAPNTWRGLTSLGSNWAEVAKPQSNQHETHTSMHTMRNMPSKQNGVGCSLWQQYTKIETIWKKINTAPAQRWHTDTWRKKKCACDGKVGIDIMKAKLKEVKGRTTKSKTWLCTGSCIGRGDSWKDTDKSPNKIDIREGN